MYRTSFFQQTGWFCNVRLFFSCGNTKARGEKHLVLLSCFFSATLQRSRCELLTDCLLLVYRTEVILEK